MKTLHETCLEYFRRRLSEGWKCISLKGHNAALLSPEGIRRELDLRNDVETLRPNGVGSETNIDDEYPDGVAHWSLVDELIADDNDTYVFNTAFPQRDLYALPAHAGQGTINKVTVYMRMASTYSFHYLGKAKTAIYTHATAYEGSEEHAPGEYTLFSTEYITNPNTGVAWTWDEIDALEAGVTLCGTAKGSRCTQVYVEVDYTYTPPTPPAAPEYQRRVLMQKQPDGSYKEVSADYPFEVHDPKVGSLISFEGTTTGNGAGDGSTLIDSVLTTKPDFNGNLVIITSGAYAGQARDINGVTTAGTVTPASNFGGQILSGVTFVIVGIRTVPAEVAAIEAKLDVQKGAIGIFHEQEDVAFNVDAILAAEADIFHLAAADTRYIVRSLRLKCVDPGAETVTVRLYELVNNVLTEVDSFAITNTNFATHHSLMDLFGLNHLAGDELQVTVQASAVGPYAVTGQYSHGKTNI